MGKKSKRGKTRNNPHHGKAKRAAQVAKMRSATANDEKAAPKASSPTNGTEPRLTTEAPDANQAQLQTLIADILGKETEAVENKVKENEAVAVAPAVDVRETIANNVKVDVVKEEDTGRGIVQTMSDDSLSVPEPLMANLHLLSPSQAKLANKLCKFPTNQPHIFAKWSTETKDDDAKKISLVEQLVRMDKAYPSGGLVGYVKNAKELLEKSKRGENPLEGWVPSVPDGEMFEIGTDNFNDFESVGLKEVGKCGFALVAGGLGERLGYGGIKVSSTFSFLFAFVNESCWIAILNLTLSSFLSCDSLDCLPNLQPKLLTYNTT